MMSDRPRLNTPHLRVVMDDGTVLDLQALNIDMLAFDRQRAKLKWPTATDAPFVWLTFLAWSAAMREKALPPMPLAEFESRAWEVSKADEDEGDEAVDPTQAEVAEG